MKNSTRLIMAVAMLLIMIIIFFCIQPDSAIESLIKETDNSDPLSKYSEFIKEVEVNPKRSIILYYSDVGHLCCAVVDKNILGYKINRISSGVAPYNENLKVGFHWFSYNRGEEWVYYGIIYDKEVAKATWYNDEATIFEHLNNRFLYAYGNSEFDGDVYRIYDSKRNELENYKIE